MSGELQLLLLAVLLIGIAIGFIGESLRKRK